MISSNDDLQSDLHRWAADWEALHPRLAKLAAEVGDARAKAILVQFAADLEVVVALPQQLRDAAGAPHRSPVKTGASQRNQEPAIILVEDDPDILIILHRLFRELTSGFDIIPVLSGADALAHLNLRHVPLVMTDYKMPELDGLQLTAAIKEVSPTTKVILSTAYHTPGLEMKARKQRVDYYLPKPYPLDKLEQIAREILLG